MSRRAGRDASAAADVVIGGRPDRGSGRAGAGGTRTYEAAGRRRAHGSEDPTSRPAFRHRRLGPGPATADIAAMDNVTHALAGLLLAETTVALVGRRSAEPPGAEPSGAGLRRTAAVIGVVGAELPDADLLYAGPILDLMDMGRLGYLLHHRGHTHTIVFALAGALVLWGIALLARRGRPP